MIYILEDDEHIRLLVKTALELESYEIREFDTALSLYAALSQTIPDLVLLDIMLPGENGLSVLRKIRENPHTQLVPVILLTAIDNDQSIAMGLDLGADDYITKPFSLLELRSRIRAVLRRYNVFTQEQRGAVFHCGVLYVDSARHLITVSETPITLSLKEYYLLVKLLEANGEVCTRKELLEDVWGKSYGESRTLDVHIRRLRNKLEEAGSYIQTVKGIGYKIEKP